MLLQNGPFSARKAEEHQTFFEINIGSIDYPLIIQEEFITRSSRVKQKPQENKKTTICDPKFQHHEIYSVLSSGFGETPVKNRKVANPPPDS